MQCYKMFGICEIQQHHAQGQVSTHLYSQLPEEDEVNYGGEYCPTARLSDASVTVGQAESLTHCFLGAVPDA